MDINKTVEILLVEDNDNDAEMALRALKKNNISNKVTRLKDGEEALDFLFCKGDYEGRNIHNLPKVILLDLKMPKVDGLEVLKAVRSNKDTEKVPIVMLTSSREERDVVEGYKLGVNSFIVKPVEFNTFMEAVKDIGIYWVLLNELP
ncbi:MAG TPA: two-component system response regulator [Balneola sp.]|jgi:DNA-binding response OmpR family regulator|nr:two-component system response regulator [Bacteroidota bacterium]MAC06035.1 two-component system response regulator [Balneola sp.]MAO77834.1 two-component system response regulator [Balneola sp.]MBF63288.1 two-component system response regulator [Balneola sp.]HAH52356.1 two-component system response regulator [Balneola sp.]|tara:strand:+ start:13894 stop:14334 length:441 start_codon:yes stop_codon:yes gene_type:complete